MLNFDKITFNNIYVLVDVIISRSINDIEHIESAFLNNATYFSDNLSFLQTIKFVTISDKHILSSSFIKSIEKIHDKQKKNDQLKLIIVRMMLRNRKNKELIKFLQYCQKFSVDEDRKEFSYMPNLTKRLKQAGIRNFLMELGFIFKANDKDKYFIDNKYIDLMINLFGKETTLTPEGLALIQKKQIELGDRAEQEILVYEKRKLKKFPSIAKKVMHVAKSNVNAGFDIESFCKKKAKKGIAEKIYIEVKAVSAIQNKFYWPANEITMAKKLKSNYYLYLLPVGLNKNFDFDNLKIIPNPYKSVYVSGDWQKKEELISVREKI